MIEKIILDYLNDAGLQAYMEEHPGMPEEYVLIEKTGGSKVNHIKGATLAIQSFSTSLYKAALLNEHVKKIMERSIEVDDICKCSLNSDYNYTDAAKKRYRYQAVFDIVYY